MVTVRFLATLALYVLLVGCSYPQKTRVVHVTNLSDPEATRIYNFMRSKNGNEETRADWLMDEAVIEVLDDTRVCFDLTIRSRHAIDLHPSQWNVKVNGVPAHVVQRAEPEKEYWTVTYERMETTYERTTPRGTTRVQRPVEYEATSGYAVRRAQACAPLASRPSQLELEVELPQENYDPNWGQRYSWRLL